MRILNRAGLLIYKISGDFVRFERTGRHSDVFSE